MDYFCNRALRAIFSVVLTLSTVSCMAFEIEDHSDQFNRAVQSSEYHLLLLNAVRASKSYPMQFSRLTGYTGTGQWGAGLTEKLTGLNVANRPFTLLDLGPSATVKSAVSQINFADLNTEEAQVALKKPLTFNELRYYNIHAEGRDSGIVRTLMIRQIRVPGVVFEKMITLANAACKKESCDEFFDEYQLSCKVNALDKHSYRSQLFQDSSPTPTLLYVVTNSAADKCTYMQFQAFRFIMERLLHFTVFPPKKDFLKKTENGSNTQLRSTKGGNAYNINISNINTSTEDKPKDDKANEYVVSFENQDLMSKVKAAQEASKRSSLPGFEIALRSPESMIRYLGEIIALQNYQAGGFSPKILTSDNHSVELFRVSRGTAGQFQVAISVTDSDGDAFYIPKPEYGSPTRDHTLEVLSFVSDVLNSAVTKKALPQTTTLTLAPQP